MITCQDTSPRFEIVAHRGASEDAPENTLPAIDLAWRQRADAVEIDVQITRDGRLVAIHDPTTDRTTGQPGVVRELTLAELQRLDARNWKHSSYARTRIPSLREVVNRIPSGKRLFVELKCDPAGLSDLEETLSTNSLQGTQVVLISFSLPLLRRTRQTLPHIPAYWVHDIRAQRSEEQARLIQRLLKLAKHADVQGLDLSACDILDAKFIASVQEAGLHLGAWTVDAPSIARQMYERGADSLTTNRPEMIRRALESE